MKTPYAFSIFTTLLVVCILFGAVATHAQTNDAGRVLVYDNKLSEAVTVGGAQTSNSKVEGYTITDWAYHRSIQFMVYPGRTTYFTVRTNLGMVSSTFGPTGKATLCVVQACSPSSGIAETFCAKGNSVPIAIGGENATFGAKVFSWTAADIGGDALERWNGTLVIDTTLTSLAAGQMETVDSMAGVIYGRLLAKNFVPAEDWIFPGFVAEVNL